MRTIVVVFVRCLFPRFCGTSKGLLWPHALHPSYFENLTSVISSSGLPSLINHLSMNYQFHLINETNQLDSIQPSINQSHKSNPNPQSATPFSFNHYSVFLPRGNPDLNAQISTTNVHLHISIFKCYYSNLIFTILIFTTSTRQSSRSVLIDFVSCFLFSFGGGGVRGKTPQKKQFQELSVQLGLTKRELAEVETNLQSTIREQKRGELTRGELELVGDGVAMYQSVGKSPPPRARASERAPPPYPRCR